MNDFERDLEYELHRIVDPMTAGPIPVRRSMQPGGSMKKLLGGAGAAIGVKILTGIAVAAAATTLAVAATEVAITGSVNPANWGQQVTTQVNACKASAARLGVHGIGQCVASFARQHGDTDSDSHAKNDKTDKTKTKTGNGNGNSNGNSNSHGRDSDKSQSSRPAITTAGEPTDPPEVAHTSIPPRP
ncbi:MAG: hypothetical protein ACYDA0_02940 [Candidatus Dormibacteraceae bacterium]